MSGGQQQRVALARALAVGPRILLLDEPFAAVDPATRRALRRELQLLHAREGTTTLQVTHDFEDALRLGSHVAVLAGGRLLQQGTPEAVFQRPNSAFVAHFTGAGTVLAGRVRQTGPAEDGRFPARFESGPLTLEVLAEREGESHAVIRPEDLLLSAAPLATSARNVFSGRVVQIERTAGVALVTVDVGLPLTAAVTAAGAEALSLTPGSTVWLTLKATAVHLV
jgi:molybdopterin-binding protein